MAQDITTVKINELATSAINSSDYFVKADVNGVAYKNTLSALATFIGSVGVLGYKGALAIADTPTEEGFYFASESGTYTNAGGLVVDLNGKLVVLSYDGSTWSKIEIEVAMATNGEVAEGDDRAVSGATIYLENYLKEVDLSKSMVNISVLKNKYDYINLTEAVLDLPIEYRIKGIFISFSDNKGKWHDYQYTGENGATNFNFGLISNWDRKSVLTNIWQPNANLTYPNTRLYLGDVVKLRNVTVSNDFSPYTDGGLKQYFISVIGRIGTDPDQKYRIGVSQKVGDTITSVQIVEVPTSEVIGSGLVASFPMTVKNNEIQFDFLIDFTSNLDYNFFELTYDLSGLNDNLILSAKVAQQDNSINTLSIQSHSASWNRYTYKDLTDGFMVEFDQVPSAAGVQTKFGLNFHGIADVNFANANKSISITSYRDRLVINRIDTGQTKEVIHSDINKFKVIVGDNLVYLLINGLLVDSYTYENPKSMFVLFEPSNYITVSNVVVTSEKANYLNTDVFGKDAVFESLTVNKIIKSRGLIDLNCTEINDFNESEINRKGIELLSGSAGEANAIYKIPIKIAPKFRLKVDFKPNFDMNTGLPDYTQIIDTMALFHSWNVGYDKMFKAYLKTGIPTSHTTTANGITVRTTIPKYNSGTRVEFGTQGYNNSYVEHTLDGYVNKPMAGDDSFYIRFTGDVNNVENQKLYITNNGTSLRIIKEGNEATPIASFDLVNYETIQDLYNAILGAGLTNFEFNFRSLSHPISALLEFEKIYFVQNIPNGNKSTGGGFSGGIHWDAFPVYLPIKDSEWHTLEIFIDNTRSRDKIRATLDGLVKNMVYRDASVSDTEVEGFMILGGDKEGNASNCFFRNLVIEPYNVESFTPKVIATIAHHITDNQDGTIDPVQGAYYSSIGSMVRFMEAAFKHGWKPITMRQLEGFLYNNESIPLRSFVMTFDDSIMELLTNVRLREAFTSRNIKPAITMIGQALRPTTPEENKLVTAAYNNGWGMMLHDSTHDMYMGSWLYSELGSHILEGVQMMLDDWGIMSDWQANNFGWGTPMSSKVMRDNGLNIAFGTFSTSEGMILSKGSNPMYLNRLIIQGDSNFEAIEDVLKFV